MNPTLKLAFAKAAELPEAAQDIIGQAVLKQVEKINWLRREIQIGIDELDAGLGRELDLEDLLAEVRRKHAGRS